jgi:hypothetical protein
MIIYKPTGQTFQNRKEARVTLGAAYYNRLEKEKRDLIFINDTQLATNEIYSNTQKVPETNRRN